MTGLLATVLRSLTRSQDVVASSAASIAYQPFVFVPIATQLLSAALPNPVTFSGNCDSIFSPCSSRSSCARICMVRKSFIIVDQFSELLRARASPLVMSGILTVRQDAGVSLQDQ